MTFDPGRAELQVTLGVFHLVHGRVKDAVAPLESFRKLQPDDPQGFLFLGQAYLQTGRPEVAKRILAEGEKPARSAGNATTAAHSREILQSL